MITLVMSEGEFRSLMYGIGIKSERSAHDPDAWRSLITKVMYLDGQSALPKGSRPDRIWDAIKSYGS